MCDSCGVGRSPPSRWALARGAGVLAAGLIAAAVLLLDPSPSRPTAAAGASNTDRVVAADLDRQYAAGSALATAGLRSDVTADRELAVRLARVERTHAAGGSAPRLPPPVAAVDVASPGRFVAAVREHLQADLLIARIEQSDGTDPVLRRRAAKVILLAEPALARLPSV